MRTRTIIQIIRAEIRKSHSTRAQISRHTGVEKATLTRIIQGGDCKSITVDALLKFFGYQITKSEGSKA